METVDGIWSSKFSVEKSINLFGIAQIGFSGNDMFSSLWCFWLDDIGQDKVNIWCSRVGQELRGELDVRFRKVGWRGGTYDTSQPSSGTGNQDDVAGHFVSVCVCVYFVNRGIDSYK